jgi:hypothetical protein
MRNLRGWLNIVVLVKHVPDIWPERKLNSSAGTLDRGPPPMRCWTRSTIAPSKPRCG